MLLTCLGATDYGDANAEATNEKEALDFDEFNKVLIFFLVPTLLWLSSSINFRYMYLLWIQVLNMQYIQFLHVLVGRIISVNHFLLYADLLFDNIFCFLLVFLFFVLFFLKSNYEFNFTKTKRMACNCFDLILTWNKKKITYWIKRTISRMSHDAQDKLKYSQTKKCQKIKFGFSFLSFFREECDFLMVNSQTKRT